MKTCPKCKIVKPFAEFNKSASRYDGLQGECKICKAERDRVYHQKNKDKIRARKRNPERILAAKAKKYGISLDLLKELILRSGGLCEICKNREGTCVDHCHETGEVRGILCRWCNSALGYFGDNPKYMEEAINYINAH